MILSCACRDPVHAVTIGLVDMSGEPMVFDTLEAMVLLLGAQLDVAIINDVSILLATGNLARGVDKPHYGVQSCIICIPDRIRHLELNIVL